MVESQGKISEKSGNFEMDIEWQPCITYCQYILLHTKNVFLSLIHDIHVQWPCLGTFVSY